MSGQSMMLVTSVTVIWLYVAVAAIAVVMGLSTELATRARAATNAAPRLPSKLRNLRTARLIFPLIRSIRISFLYLVFLI